MHRDVQPVLGSPSWRSGAEGQVETEVSSSIIAAPSYRSGVQIRRVHEAAVI